VSPLGAIVLAGGSGTRLGGVRKPELRVGGVRLLDRVLSALVAADPVVVVGPEDLAVPDGVRLTRETPPGGGPVAAIAAAFHTAAFDIGVFAEAGRVAGAGRIGHDGAARVAILGGDLPALRPADVDMLSAAVDGRAHVDGDIHVDSREDVDGGAHVDGAIYVDDDGRRQWLCGVWRADALMTRLHEFGTPAGGSLRALFGPLRVAEVRWRPGADETLPPYFDCDTEEDLRRAEEWWAR